MRSTVYEVGMFQASKHRAWRWGRGRRRRLVETSGPVPLARHVPAQDCVHARMAGLESERDDCIVCTYSASPAAVVVQSTKALACM